MKDSVREEEQAKPIITLALESVCLTLLPVGTTGSTLSVKVNSDVQVPAITVLHDKHIHSATATTYLPDFVQPKTLTVAQPFADTMD